ncbi:N-myristoyl transferase [Sistotremastrum suecicum HHB10207 ss-3]|uniref:Glycylpeptide N-tetradecanoyltransferase n=1 Tax=Sistotremastrum suecicum HHB10207 ss-3 TaxID=1314776 RepID=A0A166FPW1_9AGAM|nr:N-myristoyl transferase [Sistotremastrum suecicum HHB10207 ss-3]
MSVQDITSPDSQDAHDQDNVHSDSHSESGSEGEAEHEPTNGEAGGSSLPASTPAASSKSKKKKKKKSKASKALQSVLRGGGSGNVPQELVDEVIQRVKEEHADLADQADEETVRQALDYLKINDVIRGKAGIAGRGTKDLGEHKFWATQPVPQLGEEPPEADGYIEPSLPRDQVRQDPFPLPKEFEWSIVDINVPAQLTEVYELLSAHYVEDHDASFRFQYTAPFLQWALKPPNYVPEWHLGVRVASNKKLVAFISGIPIHLNVRGNRFTGSEINFLCVHKKLRSKRLAPVLIKEITRQCHLKGIFQAIYTAGVVLPTPLSTCRYHHRLLNVPKLVDVKFTSVPRSSTVARMIRIHKLPPSPFLSRAGLREIENKDVKGVHKLLSKYMERFDMRQEFGLEEVRHMFLSGKGVGELKDGRRENQVLWTYVVEDPKSHQITDFFSFYNLPSSVIGNTKHAVVDAVYLFYYATDAAFGQGDKEEVEARVDKRLTDLIADALVVADQAHFDVFNALTLMDNWAFLKELKFGNGDGMLNYYLYNWRTAPLAGVNPIGDRGVGKGVGVIML